jgi:hypothetical protein
MNLPKINIAQQLIRRIYAEWPSVSIYPECGQDWSQDYAIFT